MFDGARVTDAVDYHARRGEMRGAVRVVRTRVPERFRWRAAVAEVTGVAGSLRGLERMRVEEPVREIVLDLSDDSLQREVVLDARRRGVDRQAQSVGGSPASGEAGRGCWRLRYRYLTSR